jgi:hypothetical protein
MKRRGFLVGVVLAAASGCLSPSLPLPPPYEPSVGPSSLGPDYVHLTGTGVEPNALVSIYNPDAPKDKLGVLVEADAAGKWQADVWAHPGDVLRIWQVVDGQAGSVTTITIK